MVLHAVTKHVHQAVIIAVGIDQDDRSEELSKALERHGFEQFLEGSAATGQGDHSVAVLEHAGFARVHVRDHFKGSEVLMTALDAGEELRDDPVDFATFGQGRIGHGAHQAMSATAVNNHETGAGQHLTQTMSGADIVTVERLAGCGIDGDTMNRHEEENVLKNPRHCNRSYRWTWLGALLLLTGLLIGCSHEDPVPAELAPGQEPYLRWCASCHGNAGEGKPPTFPPLAGSEWLELSDEALAMIILYGLRGEIEVAGRTYRGYMPPMQHLSDQDIAEIVAFMLTQWGDRESGLDEAEVRLLRDVFQGRRPPLDGWDGVQEAVEELP
jgi:mono/diheme cytochrome c family protein